MDTQRREKILILASIFCISALAADKILLPPLINLWSARNLEITELGESLVKGKSLLGRETMMKSRWREMKNSALPQNITEAENLVLKAVDRWVQESRIQGTSFKFQWRDNEENYSLLECRASYVGTMKSIVRFLYELEVDPLALKLEEVELSPRDESGKSVLLIIRFTGLLFVEEKQ